MLQRLCDSIIHLCSVRGHILAKLEKDVHDGRKNEITAGLRKYQSEEMVQNRL